MEDQAQQVQAGGEPASEGTPQVQDYIERVRTDPDFAEKEVRNLKSRYDSTDSTLRKLNERLGSARELLEKGQLQGDALVRDAQAWSQVVSDPGMAKLIAKFAETGKAPEFPDDRQKGNGMSNGSGFDTTDDEWVDPDVKALRGELAEVKGQLQQALSRLGHTESSYGMSAMQTNFSSAVDKIGMPVEIAERIREEVADEVGNLSSRAQRGDAAAQQTFQLLTGQTGGQQIERLVRSRLTDDDWEEIVKHRGLRKQKGLSALSTGGPGMNVEPDQVLDPKRFKGNWKEALRQARLHPERNQSQ